MGRIFRLLVVCSVLAVLLGSVGSSEVSSAAPASKKPIVVGLLTDVTGPASSTFISTESGVLARFKVANSEGGVNGHPLKLVVGDTQSSPNGALTAAQSLNSQGALGILAVSAVTFGASRYMTQAKIPVAGASFDGTEWASPASLSNMFPVEGYYNPNFPAVTTIAGFFKAQGATDVGAIGAQTPVTMAAGATDVSVAAKHLGLKSSYLNTNMPPTTVDFSSIALAIKQSGVDAMFAPLGVAQSIALMTALSQAGVHLKVFLALTGYGQSTLDNAELKPLAAQGNVYFQNRLEPLEMNTAATKAFATAAKNEGIKGIPEFGATEGWLAADLFITGLEGAGANPTRVSLISGLHRLTDYTAGGLYGTHGVNFSKLNTTVPSTGPNNCAWYVHLLPGKFVPVTNGIPTCGTFIPNTNAL
jgi:ABC-type branched-subunit amino acid transport system substrate-binding protein